MCDELQEHIDGLFGPLDQSRPTDESRV
jgi:hypothetical protein